MDFIVRSYWQYVLRDVRVRHGGEVIIMEVFYHCARKMCNVSPSVLEDSELNKQLCRLKLAACFECMKKGKLLLSTESSGKFRC